jgi:hypothetical protein
MEPPLHPSEVNRFEHARQLAGIGRWFPVALVRFMAVFFIGVAATLAWQSYGNAARRMFSGVAPGLGWLVPPPAPAGPAAADFPDQLAAISHSVAAIRDSVDRLTADVAKLRAAAARTSGPVAPAIPAAAPARRPTPPAR